MVSIILPSYNSEKTISDVLNALQSQNYNEPYEIILVDSSIDKTPEIVKKEYPHIKYIQLEKKTDPGTARNIGLKESSGDIILFIDSDCVASTNWLSTLVNLHRTTEYAAIGGGVINGNDPKSEIAWAGYLAEFREFIPEHGKREVKHIPTCNISYKRSFLERLGGFNPDYYPQEDLDLNYRLCNSGGKILFYPDATVAHNHRTNLTSFFKHQNNVGKITSRMLKILPLEGASIARSKLKTILSLPILPVIKWLRTLRVFLILNPSILKKHPLSVIIFGLGLIPWSAGFFYSVFFNNPKDY